MNQKTIVLAVAAAIAVGLAFSGMLPAETLQDWLAAIFGRAVE